MANRSSNTYPSWTPPDLSDWLSNFADKFPNEDLTLFQRLATDQRMREVWAWHEDVRDKVHGYRRSGPLHFVLKVESAMRMPGKPGNMPPKQRAKYFETVRRHAHALIELLSNTCYDRPWDNATQIDTDETSIEKKIGKYVLSAQSYLDFEAGRADITDLENITATHIISSAHNITVAYKATDDGLYEMPFDYPDSHLIEILYEICAWTREDDYWDRAGMISSKSIRQTGLNARVIHFNCTLYEALLRVGIKVPFPVLATVANVALDLTEDQQIDEDTARKQVDRYLQRKGVPDKLPRTDDSDAPF